MAAELNPGQLLDQFLQRANSSRQSDKGVGALEHFAFALVHAAGDDHFVVVRRPLLLHQEFRDDAGGLAAVREHGLGDCAHQADRAAAVDEPHAVFGEDLAEFFGRLDKGRLRPRARSAINADRIDFTH